MRWSPRSAIGILLGGVSLLAQTDAPPAEPKVPAASQVEEAAKKQASQQGSSEPTWILTDTMGVDFKPYLSRVLRDVRQNWCSLIPEAARPPQVKRGKVVLEFAILKDGSVAGLRVVGTSGDIALDRPAYGSITGSNPFPPLPAEFKGPYLGLRLSFYYNFHPDEANQGVGLSCPSDYVSNEMAKATETPEAQPSSDTPGLMEAGTFYRNGNFDEAAQKYQHLLDAHPKSAEAYAGLARVYLKQKKVQQAHDTISKGLEVADSAPIHVALGEVLFREGRLQEAESEWLNLLNSGHADARAHLGLARVSIAATQYKQAKTQIDEAHRLDPTDLDIELEWILSLKPIEQISYLESYLTRDGGGTAEKDADLRNYLDALQIRFNDSNHVCRLANKPTSAQTDLLVITGETVRHIRGHGLVVALNGHNSKLLLDTGADGIVIDRKIAERAGLTRLLDTTIGGFGDRGRSTGYFARASSIKIGDLEFQDCPIRVVDKRSVLGLDGIVGTNVFQEFLIEVDFQKNKLRLGKLPNRPDESPDQAPIPTKKVNLTPGESNTIPSTADAAMPVYTSLVDRFRPAQFSFSFAPVFRFGHTLLIPTEVGDNSAPKLFLLDTGSPGNMFSANAAHEFARVREDPRMTVKGLSGSVNKVYGAEKTSLHFANIQQYADNDIALDLESLSENVGTEVSGILGALSFAQLVVTIDYRDGFVGFDFNTDP
jgi:TonB family protein